MRTSKKACITVFIFVVSLFFSGYTFEKKEEIASDYFSYGGSHVYLFRRCILCGHRK